MKDLKDNRKRMMQQVSELNNRIVRARDLLLSGDIEATDFRTIKMDCEKQITILEAKLHSTWGDGGKMDEVSTARERMNISTANENDIIHILDKAVNNLAKLDSIYLEATTIKKRQIVGSMFPEKLTLTVKIFEPRN
ncbi:MAG: hypothetical protein ABUT20_48170 [Bacteroidota bacterium]